MMKKHNHPNLQTAPCVLNPVTRQASYLLCFLATALLAPCCHLLIAEDDSPAADVKQEPTAEKGTTTASGAEESAAETKPTDSPAARKAKSKALIKQAYELSRKVNSIEDLEKIVAILSQVEHDAITAKDARYVRTLQGWALNNKAKRLVADTDRLLKIGKQQQADETLRQALAAYTSAIKNDKSRASSFHGRGVVLASQKKFEQAIADFDQAIRLIPDNVDSWFNRAELQFEQKEFDLAAGDYTEVLSLKPEDVQALTGRAHCYLQLGNIEDAIKDYQQVVKLRPQDSNALVNLADAQQSNFQWKAARATLTAALEADASNARAYRRSAWLWSTCPVISLRNPELAQQAIQRAIELTGSETSENLETLAAVQAANGDFKTAQRSQQRAIEMSTDQQENLDRMQQRLEIFAKSQPYLQSENQRR